MAECSAGRCRRTVPDGESYCCAPCQLSWQRSYSPTDMHSERCNLRQGPASDSAESIPTYQPFNVPAEPEPDPPSVRYQSHSDTSAEAAHELEESGGAQTLRRLALGLLMDRGSTGATGREVAEHFGGQITSWHPRLVELEEEGLVTRLERRRENDGTGRNAHVYVAKGWELPDDRPAPGPSKRCPHCGGML